MVAKRRNAKYHRRALLGKLTLGRLARIQLPGRLSPAGTRTLISKRLTFENEFTLWFRHECQSYSISIRIGCPHEVTLLKHRFSDVRRRACGCERSFERWWGIF